MSKTTFTLLIIVIVAAIAGDGYWIYVKYTSPQTIGNSATNVGSENSVNSSGNIFSPLSGDNIQRTNGVGTPTGASTSVSTSSPAPRPPSLRELSATPVGGMSAMDTATSTIVRWIDRGTGYVYQTSSDSLNNTELSNTTVPMIYQSFWNKNLTAFIFQSLTDNSDAVTTFYTVLSSVPVTTTSSATSTASTTSTNTPYQLRGEPLPSNTAEIALSPEKTSVFSLALSGTSPINSSGIGYISQFDGSKKIEIFSTPLTELNVEWPTDNIVALTTKGSSVEPGFLYFVNAKTGTFTNVLGNIKGLDTLTNHDATEVLYSTSAVSTGGSTDTPDSITTSIYDVKSGTSHLLAFNTLPEKCLWSTLNKDDLICAVPSQIPRAQYPEAWYAGTIGFSDSIWEINVSTGEVHELADLLNLSKKQIDVENLTLDPKENFLYFMNKYDLTLWSLGLNG